MSIISDIKKTPEYQAEMEKAEKLCCHHLPVGEHCPACEDDERGDQEYHSRRDEEVE